MLILAKPQEIFGADFPGQSKPLCSQPNPFTGNALAFIVVIANRQVFLEVFFCVLEVVLRLSRDHATDFTRLRDVRCVSQTHSAATYWNKSQRGQGPLRNRRTSSAPAANSTAL